MLRMHRSLLVVALFLVAFLGGCAVGSPSSPETPDAQADIPPTSSRGPTGIPTTAERISVEVTTSTEYYTVYGKTTEEILAYIENYGPLDDKGQRAHGVTHYKSRLDWRMNSEPRACSVASMKINVELRVVLPALDDLSRLPAELQAKWTKFADGVAAHEQRHVEIYLSGAEATKEGMLALQPGAGCAALQSRVDELWTAQQKFMDEAQERFHRDDISRIEALRAPMRAQIEALKQRLDSLTAQIASLDSSIASISSRLSGLKTSLDYLKDQMKAMEDSYGQQPAPDDAFRQYESLRAQYNGLIPGYNALIEQYNAQVVQRRTLAAQAEDLRVQANALVDQYNWTS